MTAAAGFAAPLHAEIPLTGWRPSTNQCWFAAGAGHSGGTAMEVRGRIEKNDDDLSWTSDSVVFRPNALYGLSFWVNHEERGSEVRYGTSFFNCRAKYFQLGLHEQKVVMHVPAEGATSPVTLADHGCRKRTVFDSPRLVELEARHRTEGGLTLGRGEVVFGHRYLFSTQPRFDAGGDTRVLEHIRGASTWPCLTLGPGGEAVHRFRVAGRSFLRARGRISPQSAHNALVEVDASADGKRWTRIATLRDALQCELAFPPSLFPAPELFLRMRSAAAMKDGDFSQIKSLQLDGDLDGEPAYVAGATTYVEKETGEVFMEADAQQYRVARPGARLPGSCDAFSVWGASSGFKIFHETPVPKAEADALCIKAAANEAEAAQLVVTPTRDIADVRVEAGPLEARKQGTSACATIPASAVQVLRVGYVDVRITSDKVGTPGLWPDPLPPQDESAFPARAGESQPFWVLVKVPKGTPKGVYRGELKVRADGRETCVPYAVEVFGFELPDRMTLQTPFGLNPNSPFLYHRAKTPEDKAHIAEMYFKILLDHHITPYFSRWYSSPKVKIVDKDDPKKTSVSVDFAEWDKLMTRIIDEGHGNAVRIFPEGVRSGKADRRHVVDLGGVRATDRRYQKLMKEYFRAIVDHLREKGWLDYAFVYHYDEPRIDDYPQVNENMALIAKYAPELKRMITNPCVKDLMPNVNTWCPTVQSLHMAEEKACRSRGDHMWWYICSSPGSAPVGEHIDHPGTDMRMWGWQSWGEDISAILVWAVTWWTGATLYPDQEHPQDPYADPMGWGKSYNAGHQAAPWCNGEGRYLYPPLACRDAQQGRTVLDPPVSCYRLELLRDGVEDYEYLAMLKRRDPSNPLLTVPKSIYRTLVDYSYDPTTMENQRELVAREIERLAKQN